MTEDIIDEIVSLAATQIDAALDIRDLFVIGV